MDQFRYIKIQPNTIDLSTRLWSISTEFVRFIPTNSGFETWGLFIRLDAGVCVGGIMTVCSSHNTGQQIGSLVT